MLVILCFIITSGFWKMNLVRCLLNISDLVLVL